MPPTSLSVTPDRQSFLADRDTIVMVVWFTWIAVVLVVACCVSGCATATALYEAPEGFWTTLENLVVAIGEDLLSIVSWFLL